MTEDTNSISTNNHPPKIIRAKVVTIKNTGGARWEVDFEGVVTRRDIHRITRVLRVEFARAQRRYSIQRKKVAIEAAAAERKAQLVQKEKVSVPATVIVPTKPKPTLKKVQVKEIIQNG